MIEGFDLPGRSCATEPDGSVHDSVHVALRDDRRDRPGLVVVPSRPWLATEPVPGDARSARWEADVTVRLGEAGMDFGGPFVRGGRTDRHLALVWGDVPGDGTFLLFRAAKIRLVDVEPGVVSDAMRPGRALVARIRLTDSRGNPLCARVRPPAIEWSARPVSSRVRPGRRNA